MKPIDDKPHDAGSHDQPPSPAVQRVVEQADKRRAPATPAEAEELAKKAVGDYLTACRMASADPVAMGNYLMKLASVTGVMMANAEGADTAFYRLRLLATAQFVLANMPKKPATLRPVQ